MESADSSFADLSFKDALSNSAESGLHNNLARAVFGQNGLASVNASGHAKNPSAGPQETSETAASLLAKQAQLSPRIAAKQLAEKSARGQFRSLASAQAHQAQSTPTLRDRARNRSAPRTAQVRAKSRRTVIAPQITANPVHVALPVAPVQQMPPVERTNPIAEPVLPKRFSGASVALPASRTAEHVATAIDAAGATHGAQEETAASESESADAAHSAANSASAANRPASEIAHGTNPAADSATQNTAVSAQDGLDRSGNPLHQNANDAAATTGTLPAAASEMMRGTAGVQSAPGSMRARGASSASGSATLREGDSIAAAQGAPVSGSVHSDLMRDSVGQVRASLERTGGAAASGSSAQSNPFAALDAEPDQPAATWIHTSARQVEAGYQDPALGWVSVRADATANGLHASLVPASTEAAQSLGSHLAGLNSFLAEHHGSAGNGHPSRSRRRERHSADSTDRETGSRRTRRGRRQAAVPPTPHRLSRCRKQQGPKEQDRQQQEPAQCRWRRRAHIADASPSWPDS